MNEDLLRQLAPAHAPPPPGWWPPAAGWWWLAAMLLLALLALAIWQRRPARRLQLAALRELERLERSADDAALARGVEHLLRRYAVARYGRDAVARLTGRDWIDFLAARGAAPLAGEPGLELLRAAYGGTVAAGSRALWLSAGRGFLRGRR